MNPSPVPHAPESTTQAHGPKASAALSPAQTNALEARLQALGQRFMQLSGAGQWEQALQVNAQAQTLVPAHPAVLGDAGLCHLRLGDLAQARACYTQAADLQPDNPNLWDGLAEVCGHQGDADGLRRAGGRALALKHAQTEAVTGRPLPVCRPLSADRRRNVVAFSLFGGQPRYCEAALLNVQAAAELLPQWVCRFYVDASVPAHVLRRLQASGAELVHMAEAQATGLSPLMWRFLAVADPGVDRFLMRDADSLISTREQAAVQAWLDSGSAFHLMRDYFTHTELLLAGLWGGCTGAWPDIREQMTAFVRGGNYLSARVADQHFLRHHIWPTVRQSVLAHDPVFGFMGGVDFPAHAPHGLGDDFHVGCNLSAGALGAPSSLPDGSEVQWRLSEASGQEVGVYASRVVASQWRADCPRPVLDKIRSGQWQVQLV